MTDNKEGEVEIGFSERLMLLRKLFGTDIKVVSHVTEENIYLLMAGVIHFDEEDDATEEPKKPLLSKKTVENIRSLKKKEDFPSYYG